MVKHKIVTKAPDIKFRSLHPTPSAGRTMDGCDLPPWMGLSGKESDFVRCIQCGFPIDRTKHPKGDGWGGNEITAPISGAGTDTAEDPTVTAGCPLCGSSEYE